MASRSSLLSHSSLPRNPNIHARVDLHSFHRHRRGGVSDQSPAFCRRVEGLNPLRLQLQQLRPHVLHRHEADIRRSLAMLTTVQPPRLWPHGGEPPLESAQPPREDRLHRRESVLRRLH